MHTNPRHHEEETEHRQPQHKLKATSSLFLRNMIANLEKTPRTTPQKKIPTQKTHTMGVTTNNKDNKQQGVISVQIG